MIPYHYKKSDILFVGINPHPGSLSRRVPFSNNKMFWYLLSDANLITESREELRDDEMLSKMYNEKFNTVYRLGFVNIIDRPTRNITGLLKDEELLGRERLTQIIKSERPKVVCFIGKVTYKKYLGLKDCSFGWQEDIGNTKVFVMHSPLRGKATVRVKELEEINKYR